MSSPSDNSMSGRNDIAIIQSCFACQQDSAERLAAIMVSRSYAHRSVVANMGDPSCHLYLVAEGAVVAEIYSFDGQQAQLTRHGPGEIFGAYPEVATPRSAFAALARQLDLVLDRMAARIGLSATGRFYRALLQLADEDGLIQPAPVIAALAVSVHTTRETASRALASVVRRGIVERQAEGLHIVSRRMLEELIV